MTAAMSVTDRYSSWRSPEDSHVSIPHPNLFLKPIPVRSDEKE